MPNAPSMVELTFQVNGETVSPRVHPQATLLEVLRNDLELTGAKYGCGEGRCGACTILMDGKRVLSCVTPVAAADKKVITTIEGLAPEASLHPVQEAFLEAGAMQCGYCTSGMILSAVGLLQENSNPTDEEIVAGMNGNICRCNGYVKIIDAVRRAAKKMQR